ncbi:PREDICTED: uncharacterized protein LOC106885481 [Calidris pugnax]|uniref:uncharacterized protein LOC106885481 n=1 Tax=Calidris pugnax TaxID=198806 RepID=UPI00071D777D|nr:PREDICTED: uncharacterized protein LOC106885481 [Calidris pugnax]
MVPVVPAATQQCSPLALTPRSFGGSLVLAAAAAPKRNSCHILLLEDASQNGLSLLRGQRSLQFGSTERHRGGVGPGEGEKGPSVTSPESKPASFLSREGSDGFPGRVRGCRGATGGLRPNRSPHIAPHIAPHGPAPPRTLLRQPLLGASEGACPLPAPARTQFVPGRKKIVTAKRWRPAVGLYRPPRHTARTAQAGFQRKKGVVVYLKKKGKKKKRKRKR